MTFTISKESSLARIKNIKVVAYIIEDWWETSHNAHILICSTV